MTKINYLENRINLLETYLSFTLDINQQIAPPEFQQITTDLWNEFISRQENLILEYKGESE